MGVFCDQCVMYSTPISTPETYNSHNECVSAGYAQGYNVFKSIDPNVSEEQRLFVAFNCKPETII